MKGYQFQVWDTEGVGHLINTHAPLTFEYANILLKEMGVNRNAKKITFIGYFYYDSN